MFSGILTALALFLDKKHRLSDNIFTTELNTKRPMQRLASHKKREADHGAFFWRVCA